MKTPYPTQTFPNEEKVKLYFEKLRQEIIDKYHVLDFPKLTFSAESKPVRTSFSRFELKVSISFETSQKKESFLTLKSKAKKEDRVVLLSRVSHKGFAVTDDIPFYEELENALYSTSEYFWELFYEDEASDLTFVCYEEDDVESEKLYEKEVYFFNERILFFSELSDSSILYLKGNNTEKVTRDIVDLISLCGPILELYKKTDLAAEWHTKLWSLRDFQVSFNHLNTQVYFLFDETGGTFQLRRKENDSFRSDGERFDFERLPQLLKRIEDIFEEERESLRLAHLLEQHTRKVSRFCTSIAGSSRNSSGLLEAILAKFDSWQEAEGFFQKYVSITQKAFGRKSVGPGFFRCSYNWKDVRIHVSKENDIWDVSIDKTDMTF